MIGLFFLRLHRQSLAVGGILSLAWWVMGAAPYAATAPGLTNSAPQFTVNQFRKGDRLPMTRTRAVRHRRLIDGDFPFASIGWQRSLAAAAPALSKLDADDQGAFSRGCAACQTGADLGGSVPQAARSAARG
jgi:hypothetical protein